MILKAEAEALFESFCDSHAVPWERVLVEKTRSPDYIVSLNGQSLYFEVKQIDEDDNFKRSQGVSSRTVGSHIRQKILDSRKQVQVGAKLGAPSILLVYNNLDPMQLAPNSTILSRYVRRNDCGTQRKSNRGLVPRTQFDCFAMTTILRSAPSGTFGILHRPNRPALCETRSRVTR